jgi:hypothetical protein
LELCHYNYHISEIHHYYSTNYTSAITILSLFEICHYLRSTRSWARLQAYGRAPYFVCTILPSTFTSLLLSPTSNTWGPTVITIYNLSPSSSSPQDLVKLEQGHAAELRPRGAQWPPSSAPVGACGGVSTRGRAWPVPAVRARRPAPACVRRRTRGRPRPPTGCRRPEV